jgi:hypothetical protein
MKSFGVVLLGALVLVSSSRARDRRGVGHSPGRRLARAFPHKTVDGKGPTGDSSLMRNYRLRATLILVLPLSACGDGTPSASALRDSFAAQLTANRFVSNVQHDGDTITFSRLATDGRVAAWRIVIDSAEVEPNDDPSLPYKGTITSSWYADGQLVRPSGRESNLPVELTSNGLAQECWALWNSASGRWEWE